VFHFKLHTLRKFLCTVSIPVLVFFSRHIYVSVLLVQYYALIQQIKYLAHTQLRQTQVLFFVHLLCQILYQLHYSIIINLVPSIQQNKNMLVMNSSRAFEAYINRSTTCCKHHWFPVSEQ